MVPVTFNVAVAPLPLGCVTLPAVFPVPGFAADHLAAEAEYPASKVAARCTVSPLMAIRLLPEAGLALVPTKRAEAPSFAFVVTV